MLCIFHKPSIFLFVSQSKCMQHSLYDRSGSFLNWKFLHQGNEEGQCSLLVMSHRLMARGALKILCECMNCIFSACEEKDSSGLHLLACRKLYLF